MGIIGVRKAVQLYKPAIISSVNSITNGTFNTDLSGWTIGSATWVWDASGRAFGTASSSAHTLSQTFTAITQQKTLSFDYEVTSGQLRVSYGIVGVYTVIQNNITGTGSGGGTVPATANEIVFQRAVSGTFYVDNVILI